MKSLSIDLVKELYLEKGLSVADISAQYGISKWCLYNLMERNSVPRRSYSEANYNVNKYRPQFEIANTLTGEQIELKIAGIMLYWAEGTLKGSTVDFANSNPAMIKIFLKFLRNICGIKEERLRVYLYTHENCNISKAISFWHSVTKISTDQFTKPYVRKGNPNTSNRKMLFGLIHIRYNDKKLLGLIKKWIEEYTGKFGGEVPKRTNGPDCIKCSFSKKFENEKRVNSGEPLKKTLRGILSQASTQETFIRGRCRD